MVGLNRRIFFGDIDDDGYRPYTLLMAPDGYTGYYDFTDVKPEEKITSSAHYFCKMK